MSDFIAEASVLILPDTTKFRAELLAGITKAAAGVKVPIPVVATPVAVGAGKVVAAQAAASAQATTAAVAEQEVSVKKLAAAQAAAAAEAVTFSNAEKLVAATTAATDAATTAGALSTTKLAAARAVLRASTAALATGEKAVTAAAETENAALIQQAEVAHAAAAAQLELASAAADAAASETRAGAAASAAAVKQGELRRGATATSLSLLGIRGATLAASQPFLIAAAAVTLTAKSLHEASDEAEAAARVERVLGDEAARTSEVWASQLAPSFGLSEAAALKAEGAFATTFTRLGVGREEAQKLSEQLVTTAADVAAFSNVPAGDVLRAFNLGIQGNARGLKALQLTITQTDVKERALSDTGKKLASNLTAQELTLARTELIFERSADAAGAFAERSGNLSAQSKILQSNLANLAGTLGRDLTPFLLAAALGSNELLKAFKKLNDFKFKIPDIGPANKGFTFFKDVVLGNINPLVRLRQESDLLKRGLDLLGLTSSGSADKIRTLGDAARSDIGPFTELNNLIAALNRQTLRGLQGQLKGLEEGLVDIQIAGGGPQAQITQLQRIEAKERAIISNAGKSVQSRRRAKQGLLDAQNQIKSIEEGIVSDQKAAAAEAKRLAAEAQAARDAADQHFLDLLGLSRGRFEIAIAQADLTTTLKDDIRANAALITFLRQSREAAKRIIQNVLLQAQTVQELTLAIIALRKANAEARDAEKQAALDRVKAAREAKQRSIELDIQLAQTTNNVRGEIAARQRLIAFLQRLARHVRLGSNSWKELRNEIAAERAAIKDLKKQLDERKNAARELQFAFLQAQQGFAATLLSNLLPVGAIAGTVGGTTGGGGRGGFVLPPPKFQPPPVSGVPLGGDQIGPRIAAETVATGGGPRAASQSQMAVLIELTRQMVRILAALNGNRKHPEANRQAREAPAGMGHL